MELNFATLILLFLRLSPFVILCFFSISSIFNSDLKGVVYLAGVLLAAGISLMSQGFISSKSDNKDDICDIISIGSGMFSNIPLGGTILGFTFMYLLQTMIQTDAEFPGLKTTERNWPTILFFIILIFFDLVLNTHLFTAVKNLLNLPLTACYSGIQSAVAYGIGIIAGLIWSTIIYTAKSPELMYFSKYKNNESCSKVSNKTFKCKVYKNGKLVSG
jgi:hypothetical protein